MWRAPIDGHVLVSEERTCPGVTSRLGADMSSSPRREHVRQRHEAGAVRVRRAAVARRGARAVDDDSRPLAGGQSLVPLLNFRFARPARLVDLNRIAGLDYVREQDGALRIGMLARQAQLLRRSSAGRCSSTRRATSATRRRATAARSAARRRTATGRRSSRGAARAGRALPPPLDRRRARRRGRRLLRRLPRDGRPARRAARRDRGAAAPARLALRRVRAHPRRLGRRRGGLAGGRTALFGVAADARARDRPRRRRRPVEARIPRGEAAMRIGVEINGERYERDVEPRTLLSDFIRHDSASPARTSAASTASAAPAPSSSTACPSARACCSPCRPTASRSRTVEGSRRRRAHRSSRRSTSTTASSAASARRGS